MMMRGTRTLVHWSLLGVACVGLHGLAAAQQPPAPPAAPAAQAAATAPAATAGARFIESCNQSLERGVADLGCQGPIYRNELERLKREALSTQNPQLFSFVADAYENPRSGLGDMGQAYRWYLLAAVRGDPRAMQRLTEMNRKGQGVPKDNVKALGYARLLQRIAQPDVGTPPHMLSLINELGTEMAVEEVALAERFAAELEARIHRQAAGEGGDPGTQPLSAAAAAPGRPGSGLPGMATTLPRANPVAPSAPAALPGSTLPGIPGKASP